MVDILTKTSANEATMKQEEMDEEFEDGELVEEGELRSDDEEEKPGLLKPASPGSQGSPSNGHATSPRDKKPSREELVAPAPSKSAVRESLWSINAKPPQQQPQHHQPQSHHDEGFGFADRDFRSMGSGAGGEDRDFRWAEGPANGGSDSDYDFRDRRRRHSPSPPPHLKRARPSPPRASVFDDEGPPFMGGRGGHFGGRGGFRGRGRGGGFGAPRWMERHICKFFREGYCRDGDNCSYSHNAEDSKRRPEVCKFYYTGHCKKGLACHHLHGEFPCKAFHKGECTREPCQFSHLPLSDYTRPLFEATMREEQYNMRQQTLPQGPPVRRRVLLPGGPVPGAPTPLMPANPAAVAAAQAAAAIVTQGLVAPPGVTPGPFPPGYVPTGAAAAPTAAAAGAAGGEGAACSAPAASLPPPSVVVPRLSTQMQHQVKQEEPAAPPVSTASAVAASAAADANGGFNISMMLAQIAGSQLDATSSNPSSPPLIHVKQEEQESPESPPAAVDPHGHFGAEWGAAGPSGAQMSYPGGSMMTAAVASPAPVVYRLRPVDHEAPYCGVSSAVISTESQQSDPRIARLLASQFDAVSSMIAAQQAAAAAAAAAAPPAQPAAPAPSRDPRARADPRSRDPRQREPEQSRVSWMPQMS